VVKFAVCTDLHYDIAPDGYSRVERFIERAQKEDVDFIIELGDFCVPKPENEAVLSLFNQFEKPKYHVIGNHDTDSYTKDEHMKWLGMKQSYYSFVVGHVNFIVIDSSFIQYENEFETYYRRNYKKSDGLYPAIPDHELVWLEQEIMDSSYPVVLFSHHSLVNSFRQRGIANREKVLDILSRVKAKGKRVLLCLNGHDHADGIDKVEDTYFFSLNSMTYKWFGPEYEHFLYDAKTHEQYPYLKDIVLYEDALSAIVSIDDTYTIDISGMQSGYQKVTPDQLGVTATTWDGRIISPHVSSVCIRNE
jgi:predicted phosphodiesterase